MGETHGDSLRPRLKKLESEIEENLEALCEEPSVKKVDTGELIRIEETLAIAANAAKEAVSLRRKMRSDGEEVARPRNP